MLDHLLAANDRRSVAGAREQVAKARRALTVLNSHTPRLSDRYRHKQYYGVLVQRIDHPRHTLAELADSAGLTKDAYWGLLRRAFVYADRLKDAR